MSLNIFKKKIDYKIFLVLLVMYYKYQYFLVYLIKVILKKLRITVILEQMKYLFPTRIIFL